MGFSEPWPSNTMSKMVELTNGLIISLHVWVDQGIAQYLYFAIPKGVDWQLPYTLLDIKPGDYPKVYNKKDIEVACFCLTGKSIYDFDIKESPEEKRQAMGFWNRLKNIF